MQRHDTRKGIELESGVRWERLTPTAEQDADFLYVVYEVGGASSREGTHMRHMGREYGLVLSGRLRVTIGFDDEHELGPGDSIAFESSRPHRLENAGVGAGRGDLVRRGALAQRRAQARAGRRARAGVRPGRSHVDSAWARA